MVSPAHPDRIIAQGKALEGAILPDGTEHD